MANDRDAIIVFYYNRGYPDVQFESTAVPVKDEPNRMDLTYKIMQGQRVAVNHVIVTGTGKHEAVHREPPNAHTRRRSAEPGEHGRFATPAVQPGAV